MIRQLLLAVIVLLTHLGSVAQEDPCDNDLTRSQTDSLKKVLSQEGYIVVREASVSMESEYDLPIIMPLSGGSLYRFIFIGDRTSDSYEVRMYDYRERQVVHEKKNTNIISYAYEPRLSEYHLIKPMQANLTRKTNLCGHVIILKKSSVATDKGKSAR